MASLQWNAQYRIVVSEMSWKEQLACSAEFVAWMSDKATAHDSFANQVAIATMLTLHSRVRVYRGESLLSNGTYDLGEGVTITLPLTKEGIEDLPGSLAQFLIQSSQEVNPQAIANFLDGVTAMTSQTRAS